jgi:hypothetical protein
MLATSLGLTTALLLTPFAAVGCGGKISEPGTAEVGRVDADDAHDAHGAVDAGPAASPLPTPIPTAGAPAGPTCGSAAAALHFPGLASFASALEGLWTSCDASFAALCGNASGAVSVGPTAGTRVAITCGHLSAHGSSFIPDPDPAHRYTYTLEASQTNPGETVAMHVQNAFVEASFTVVLRRPADANESNVLDVATFARGGGAPVIGLRRASLTY